MMTPLPHVPDECVRIDDYWGGGPWPSPWAAPALDAGREPRRRQCECAAAKSKAGVLWLVQAADR